MTEQGHETLLLSLGDSRAGYRSPGAGWHLQPDLFTGLGLECHMTPGPFRRDPPPPRAGAGHQRVVEDALGCPLAAHIQPHPTCSLQPGAAGRQTSAVTS